eukprot:5942892-Ditylum_brightwellii.AAC.1
MAKTSKMQIREETAKDANEMEMADQDNCPNKNETLLAKDKDASLIALQVFSGKLQNWLFPTITAATTATKSQPQKKRRKQCKLSDIFTLKTGMFVTMDNSAKKAVVALLLPHCIESHGEVCVGVAVIVVVKVFAEFV